MQRNRPKIPGNRQTKKAVWSSQAIFFADGLKEGRDGARGCRGCKLASEAAIESTRCVPGVSQRFEGLADTNDPAGMRDFSEGFHYARVRMSVLVSVEVGGLDSGIPNFLNLSEEFLFDMFQANQAATDSRDERCKRLRQAAFRIRK